MICLQSLGVVLYILVSGGFPFPGSSMDKLKRAVLSGQVKIPYWVSVGAFLSFYRLDPKVSYITAVIAECADLIRKMLVVNPTKRYSVQQVVQHRYVSIFLTRLHMEYLKIASMRIFIFNPIFAWEFIL